MDLAEESLLAELIMSRRLDFGKDFRNHQARYGMSVKEKTEWMKNDAAARWLQKNENRALRKADHHLYAVGFQMSRNSKNKNPTRTTIFRSSNTQLSVL
jgi:hypothetical protein